MIESKKKAKPEDFIGWKSEDGKLKVIGLADCRKFKNIATFKVTCKICSPDLELYPDGYFISTKANLKKGKKPCGCSRYEYSETQYSTILKRIAKNKGFIVHKFSENFNGIKTKIDCECEECHHKWTPTISQIINNDSACPVCAIRERSDSIKKPEHEVLKSCHKVCNEKGYKPIGFDGKYIGISSTSFKYICPEHGEHKTSCRNFIDKNRGCPKCVGAYIQTQQEALEKCKKICEEMNYETIGFPDGYKNTRSSFEYRCPKHGVQSATYRDFIKSKHKCVKCAHIAVGKSLMLSPAIALRKCETVCKHEGYTAVGFPDGYKNNKSKFTYICPTHGKMEVEYNSFINSESRCLECWKDKQKEVGGFYGWYPERAEEQDFIYVMNFNDKYIKVGRSFNVKTRNTKLKSESKIKNIKVLSVYTAKHGIIYPTEQEIHAELRERNFDYYPETWSSTECFQNDSLYVVEKLLEQSGLEKVEDYRKVKYNAKD